MFSRRSFFGRSAGAAALAAAAPPALSQMPTPLPPANYVGSAAAFGKMAADVATGQSSVRALLFTSFGEWWSAHGEKQMEHNFRHSHFSVPPEIDCLRLPLTTKMRMAKEMAKIEYKKAREREFRQQLRYGPFLWYPEEYD